MPRYKTAYRDTDYFWGSDKISSKYTKNTEFYPNQNLFKNISTSYLTFKPTTVFEVFPDKNACFACGTSALVRTTLRIPHNLFQQTLILRPLLA